MFGDGHSKPRSPVFPGYIDTLLRKFLEDLILVFFVNSNPGIGNYQLYRLLVSKAFFHPAFKENASLVGKLNGITQEDKQDLVDSVWITNKERGNSFIRMHTEFKPFFLGFAGKHITDLVQKIRQAERH